MHDDSGDDHLPPEQPSAADATEQKNLPDDFMSDGEKMIDGLQKLIDGMPVLTVASALTATLYAAVTQPSLDQQAKEALSIMVWDLASNVLASNEISEERLQVIMAQRGGVEIQASRHGSIAIPQEGEEG